MEEFLSHSIEYTNNHQNDTIIKELNNCDPKTSKENKKYF